MKTRMIPVLGAELAARLYRLLAEEVCFKTGPGEYDRILFFSPPEAREELSVWFPGETLVEQEGADLGARLSHAFREAFARGARRVTVIGTDTPAISRALVQRAFRALEGCDLVLGPARDGGYYLLALREERPELFREIPWSSPRVFEATHERARKLGLSIEILEPLTDIDTLEDLQSEWAELRPLLSRDRELLLACSSRFGEVSHGRLSGTPAR